MLTLPKVIYWFRQDLRLQDNPALYAAAKAGAILPIYILDDKNAGDCAIGAASRVWLHHSLTSLNESLKDCLSIYKGDPLEIIRKLCLDYGVQTVFWNRCYEPWRIQRDITIKQTLEKSGITVKSYKGSLLWEPWMLKKEDGTPYKVFTAFYRRACLEGVHAPESLGMLPELSCVKDLRGSLTVSSLKLLPTVNWDKTIESHWKIGEAGAEDCLEAFIKNGLAHYKEGRDFPAKAYVSRLSPYLHFGEISPQSVWHRVRCSGDHTGVEHFCRELGWREFSYHLLYFNNELPKKNLQDKFDSFPWKKDSDKLWAWQKGQTGIPMVDAGMRELWQTGYIHNRVRMIVGSFLVKNLLLDWRSGAQWFWDCLVDADLANNSASWQWVAGCGADAAPYFRIFNPVTQGQKFDPQGDYVRKYVPELKEIPERYLFNPWEAPPEVLKRAGVLLGETYPRPVVGLKTSREDALKAFESLKK